MQTKQVLGPHEEYFAAVAFSVAVGRLLEGEVDHAVDYLGANSILNYLNKHLKFLTG